MTKVSYTKNQFTRIKSISLKNKHSMFLWNNSENKEKLYQVLNAKNRQKIRLDQERRASYVAEYMKINNLNKLIMLDGDGRMIMQIIHFLEIAGIMKPHITVVEIDKERHEYHKNELATDIIKVNDNIFNYKSDDNQLIYFNFCSIGNLVNDMKSCNFIHQVKKHKHSIIGFTTEGTKKGHSLTKKRKPTELKKTLRFLNKHSELVSQRKPFYRTVKLNLR